MRLNSFGMKSDCQSCLIYTSSMKTQNCGALRKLILYYCNKYYYYKLQVRPKICSKLLRDGSMQLVEVGVGELIIIKCRKNQWLIWWFYGVSKIKALTFLQIFDYFIHQRQLLGLCHRFPKLLNISISTRSTANVVVEWEYTLELSFAYLITL